MNIFWLGMTFIAYEYLIKNSLFSLFPKSLLYISAIVVQMLYKVQIISCVHTSHTDIK